MESATIKLINWSLYVVNAQVDVDGILFVSDEVSLCAGVRTGFVQYVQVSKKEKKRFVETERETKLVSFLIYGRKDQFILLYSTFLIQYQAIKWNNSRRKTCSPSYFYEFMVSLDAATWRLICINRSALYWYLFSLVKHSQSPSA